MVFPPFLVRVVQMKRSRDKYGPGVEDLTEDSDPDEEEEDGGMPDVLLLTLDQMVDRMQDLLAKKKVSAPTLVDEINRFMGKLEKKAAAPPPDMPVVADASAAADRKEDKPPLAKEPARAGPVVMGGVRSSSSIADAFKGMVKPAAKKASDVTPMDTK